MIRLIVLVLISIYSVNSIESDFYDGCLLKSNEEYYQFRYFCKKTESRDAVQCFNTSAFFYAVDLVIYTCGDVIKSITVNLSAINRFTELRKLDISKLGINNLTFMWNKGFSNVDRLNEKLYVLNASHNHFTEFPVSIAVHLPKLVYIDFSHNEITQLNFAGISNSNRISSLNCAHNKIKSIKKGAFTMLKELTNLDLSHNPIETIHNDIFDNDTKMKVLNLTNNLFKQFDFDVFSNKSLEVHTDLRPPTDENHIECVEVVSIPTPKDPTQNKFLEDDRIKEQHATTESTRTTEPTIESTSNISWTINLISSLVGKFNQHSMLINIIFGGVFVIILFAICFACCQRRDITVKSKNNVKFDLYGVVPSTENIEKDENGAYLKPLIYDVPTTACTSNAKMIENSSPIYENTIGIQNLGRNQRSHSRHAPNDEDQITQSKYASIHKPKWKYRNK